MYIHYIGRTLQESVASSVDYKVFICEEEAKSKDGYNQPGSGGPVNGRGGVWTSGGSSGTKLYLYMYLFIYIYTKLHLILSLLLLIFVSIGSNAGGTKKRVVNFWAFSPGIAMEDLKRLGVRSILLTSGTISFQFIYIYICFTYVQNSF